MDEMLKIAENEFALGVCRAVCHPTVAALGLTTEMLQRKSSLAVSQFTCGGGICAHRDLRLELMAQHFFEMSS
jgi:hypothetical protein